MLANTMTATEMRVHLDEAGRESRRLASREGLNTLGAMCFSSESTQSANRLQTSVLVSGTGLSRSKSILIDSNLKIIKSVP